MAVRVVALLIPLAITLPQLRMSRPEAPAVQSVAAAVVVAEETASAHESRRVSEAALTQAVPELPAQDILRTLESPAESSAERPAASSAARAAETAVATGMALQVRKTSPRRTVQKPPRAVMPVKLASTAAGRQATRQITLMPADAGCAPSLHCAPVVVAKATPVVRRPL